MGRRLSRRCRFLVRDGPGRRWRICRRDRLHISLALRLRVQVIALGNEAVGRLLYLIGRQRGFRPRRRHIVNRWKHGVSGGAAGSEQCRADDSQGCEHKLREASGTIHPRPRWAPTDRLWTHSAHWAIQPWLDYAWLIAASSLPWLKTYAPNGLQKPTETPVNYCDNALIWSKQGPRTQVQGPAEDATADRVHGGRHNAALLLQDLM